jgi:hypothetical protein
MSAIADDDLHAELAALRAENEKLRAGGTADPSTAPPRRSSGRWRAVVSAIFIVVAAILVPVSIVSAWARVELIDEDAFVSTLAPLAGNTAVQGMIIDETMSGINEQVDFDQITANVFDGIAGLGAALAALADRRRDETNPLQQRGWRRAEIAGPDRLGDPHRRRPVRG